MSNTEQQAELIELARMCGGVIHGMQVTDYITFSEDELADFADRLRAAPAHPAGDAIRDAALEAAARVAEAQTARRRTLNKMLNSAPQVEPCTIAAAIRALRGPAEQGERL